MIDQRSYWGEPCPGGLASSALLCWGGALGYRSGTFDEKDGFVAGEGLSFSQLVYKLGLLELLLPSVPHQVLEIVIAHMFNQRFIVVDLSEKGTLVQILFSLLLCYL